MKTIEERAKIYAQKAIEYACGRRVGEPNYITNLFIEMATEQKSIDIDKACKWVDDNVGTFTAIALRKAMEEEL